MCSRRVNENYFVIFIVTKFVFFFLALSSSNPFLADLVPCADNENRQPTIQNVGDSIRRGRPLQSQCLLGLKQSKVL